MAIKAKQVLVDMRMRLYPVLSDEMNDNKMSEVQIPIGGPSLYGQRLSAVMAWFDELT